MSCQYKASLFFICLFGFCSVGLLITAAVSNEWFGNHSTGMKTGLWRSCVIHKHSSTNESCSTRADVLTFKDGSKDFDIMLIVMIGAGLLTLIAILILLLDVCAKRKTKCCEITFTLLLMLATLSGVFLVIYNEVEILKDAEYVRRWGAFTMYGGVGALLLASILSFVHVVFCHRPYNDKTDSLVLRTQRASWKEPKYQPTHQYLHGMGIDNSSITLPPPYTANVYVKGHSNWIDR